MSTTKQATRRVRYLIGAVLAGAAIVAFPVTAGASPGDPGGTNPPIETEGQGGGSGGGDGRPGTTTDEDDDDLCGDLADVICDMRNYDLPECVFCQPDESPQPDPDPDPGESPNPDPEPGESPNPGGGGGFVPGHNPRGPKAGPVPPQG